MENAQGDPLKKSGEVQVDRPLVYLKLPRTRHVAPNPNLSLTVAAPN